MRCGCHYAIAATDASILNYAIEFLTIMVACLTHLNVSLVCRMHMFNTRYDEFKTVEI